MKVVCMVCGREKAGTSGDEVSHSICARCIICSEYRGGSLELVKNDPEILHDLKDNIQDEITDNVKWIPPENNPNWKDKEFSEEDIKFYEDLKREAETEIKLGLRR